VGCLENWKKKVSAADGSICDRAGKISAIFGGRYKTKERQHMSRNEKAVYHCGLSVSRKISGLSLLI
jgi:hypothetical protein